MKLVIAGLVAATSIASAATGAQAQSFNCRKAYFPDEKLICTSPRLSMLDERLDWIFRQNMRLLAKPGRDALDREEERWVVARRRCGSDHRCVEGFYRSRIGELTGRLGEARDDDRDEPSATRGPGRDGPPPERFSSEPPPAEPPRAERGQPDRSERATAAPTAKRQSSRGEASGSSREEEAAGRRGPAAGKQVAAIGAGPGGSAGTPRHRRCGQRAGTVSAIRGASIAEHDLTGIGKRQHRAGSAHRVPDPAPGPAMRGR